MKLQLRLLILSLFISFIGYSQTISVSGTIATNTTWSADTVKVTGDITVNIGIILTVNPHTYVEFQGYYSITILGRMLAVGNITDTISFAIKDTTGYSNSSSTFGGWNAISVNCLSAIDDSSIFEYCKMRNSKYSAIYTYNCKVRIEHCLFYNNYNAVNFYTSVGPILRHNFFNNNNNVAINIYKSNPLISYNYIMNSSFGIEAFEATPEISYNTISNNFQGITINALFVGSLIHHNSIIYNSEGIAIASDSNTTVSNNIINHNSNTIFSGGGIDISESSSVIINNIIAYNSARGGGGIFISNHSSTLIISNKIANNYASDTGCGLIDNGGGILCVQSSPLIMNNLISNNETESNGGGIACLDTSSLIIINNTIVNNKSNNLYGGGAISIVGPSGNFISENNIIWGNDAPTTSKQIYLDPRTQFISDYDDIADTLNFWAGPIYDSIIESNYQHLMMSDPLFKTPSSGVGIAFDGLAADWSLQSISPCINAGTPDTTGLHLFPSDIFGDPRILNDTVDMGAYEYTPTMSISEINNFINNNLLVYPNPANEDINIIKNIKASNLFLKITDVLGQVVYEENEESTTTFFYKTVNVSGFSKGMYSISLTDNKGDVYSKLIIKE